MTLFDTSLDTNNLGDEIIMQYANKVLKDIIGKCREIRLPTHRMPSCEELNKIEKRALPIMCGTNILCADVSVHDQWARPDDARYIQDTLLFSVGMQDNRGLRKASANWYRAILNKRLLHSVRDSRTQAELRDAGIHNVLNTGCVTMWNLTPEHCDTIPANKSESAILTLTHYRSGDFNQSLLNTVTESYKTVYFWPQGDKDIDFLKSLDDIEKYIVLPRSLEAFEKTLGGGCDYIGTRLHGGIHAMNFGVRTLIVDVDSRISDIARDTHLPIIEPENISSLGSIIHSEWKTKIDLPFESIRRWKDQFRGGNW